MRYNQTGQYTKRPASGRKQSTNERDKRFLTLSVLRDRSLTSNVLATRLLETRRTQISSRTVRMILHEGGLSSHKPARCPSLTAAHRVNRMRFAENHRNLTIVQWSSVMFSDESRFCLRSPDGRERVRRRPGERFAPCCISPRTPFGGGGVMVWAGISFEGRTGLIFVERGTLTADRYTRQCLQDHVVPYGPFVDENFLFMHDTARPHTARIVRNFLDAVEIPVLEWPARSPDMNPIEHVWDMLGRQVRNSHCQKQCCYNATMLPTG